MARKRKKRGPNILEIKIRKVELPKGTTTAQYIAGLKRAVRTKELPEGWNVDIAWRNPNTLKGRTRNWQQGDWSTTLRESRRGFATVVNNVLRKFAGEQPTPRKKAAPRKKTAAQVFKSRSAAAKKGWATRRANAAAKTGGKTK